MLNKTLNFAKGHQNFKDVYFKQHEKEFIRLVKEGQNPQILFIGCSDSRIVPDLILGTKPGDLFVIRTAGNFVPIYDACGEDGISATICYALEVLNVKHIIICGHSHCGAIQALVDNHQNLEPPILKNWLKWGEQAKKMTLQALQKESQTVDLNTITGQVSVVYQLEHLMTFPTVKQRVEEGSLELHGWYYSIESADLTCYDSQLSQFVSIMDLQ